MSPEHTLLSPDTMTPLLKGWSSAWGFFPPSALVEIPFVFQGLSYELPSLKSLPNLYQNSHFALHQVLCALSLAYRQS